MNITITAQYSQENGLPKNTMNIVGKDFTWTCVEYPRGTTKYIVFSEEHKWPHHLSFSEISRLSLIWGHSKKELIEALKRASNKLGDEYFKMLEGISA